MSVCRAGMKCEFGGMVPAAVAQQRTPDEIRAAVRTALEPMIVCWRLRDEIQNSKFLRNASGVLIGGGVVGTGLWAATHDGDDRKKGLVVGGGVTALGVTGLAHQSYNIDAAEKEFIAKGCPELIAADERASASVWKPRLQSMFSEVALQKRFAMPKGALASMIVGLGSSSGRKITWEIGKDEEGRPVYRPKIEVYGPGMEAPDTAVSGDAAPDSSEEAVAFGVAGVDLCPGADVLVWGCTPARTLPKVYEFSTDVEEIQRQQFIIGGILVAPAVALYGVPAGISALAGWGEGIAALLNSARPLAASL